jgi:hypothetical protein
MVILLLTSTRKSITHDPDRSPTPSDSSQNAGCRSVQWTRVFADGMDPALGPPLGEQVVFAVVVDQAVETVEPAFLAFLRIQP